MTQEELQKALEAISKSGITVNGDLVLSKQVENEIGNVEAGGIGIQNNYANKTSKATKQKEKKSERKANGKPKTLRYYTHGNKGVLKKQGERLRLVFDKWNKWGWIDDKTSTDDFDAFFEGEPRHCNMTWKANSTVLSVLMRELLEQPYIAGQKRQSASSMVREQFGLTPNFDANRLDDDDKFRIDLTVYLLNINNPLPLRKGGNDDDYVTTDAALQAVLSGQLRITKGI